MKKVLFLIALFVISFAVLGGITNYQMQLTDEHTSVDGRPTAYIAKYRDCINLEDFPRNLVLEKAVPERISQGPTKMEAEINKFGKGLEEAVNNLNHIEAHNHIHREFHRSLKKFGQAGLTHQQRLYYLETMRLCYESDKALNLRKVGNL